MPTNQSAKCLILLVLFLGGSAAASDWPAWRGDDYTGATDTLNIDWANLADPVIWRVDFAGRSTPVIMDGRICATGRVGDGERKQEQVVCLDAETGRMIWDRRFNVFLTSVPFPRVGWASLVGDPATGYLYFHGVGGLFICLDRDGNVVWEKSLTEEFGRFSGYGGRTHTAVVDGDLVYLGFVTFGWGEFVRPLHRVFAFDKRTGVLVWHSSPGGAIADANTYSTPSVGTVDGVRMLFAGNGDGGVYALKAATGEKVWGFKLSMRGMNASTVFHNGVVFASHSEENVDEVSMGRVVALDQSGHEKWRANKISAGFATPAVGHGMVLAIDNSGNLSALDESTGAILWEHSLGTVGKGSPVIAGDVVFAPEVNGMLHILKANRQGFETLRSMHFEMPGEGRDAEIYGSPAIAYNRVYLATEEGLYCFGDKTKAFDRGGQVSMTYQPERGSGPATHIQIVPAEIIVDPAHPVRFEVRFFNEKGQQVNAVGTPEWTTAGIPGTIDTQGQLQVGTIQKPAAGSVSVKIGNLESKSRVRVYPDFPWREDFESVADGKYPPYWVGANNKFAVTTLQDGSKVLLKNRLERGIQRGYVSFGSPDLSNYTMEADLLGVRDGRRIPDMGLIVNRYAIALEGNYQRLSVHTWVSEKRVYKHVEFPWEADKWYRMKAQVSTEGEMTVIRVKVWPRDESEPGNWSFVVEDPIGSFGNDKGSPGIYGQSYSDIYFDNIVVARSQ